MSAPTDDFGVDLDFDSSPYLQQMEAQAQADRVANSSPPAKHAEDLKLSRQTGLPIGAINHSPDVVKRELTRARVAAELSDDPKLVKYAAQHPDSLAVHADDIKPTSLLGQMAEIYSSTDAQTTMRDIYNDIWWRGPGSFTPNNAERWELERLAHEGRFAGETYGRTGLASYPLSLARILPSIVGGTLTAAGTGVAAAGTAVAATAAAGAVVPFPEELATLPAAAVTWGGRGAFFGYLHYAVGQEKGGAYQEYLNYVDPTTGDRMDPYAAWTAALLFGAAAGAVEALAGKVLAHTTGGAKLLKMLGKEPMRKMLARPSVVKAFARFAKRVGGTVTSETLTEVIQEALVMFGGELTKAATETLDSIQRPEQRQRRFTRMTPQERKERLGHTALETFKGTVLLGIGGSISGASVDVYGARKAQRYYASLNETMDAVQERPAFQHYKDELEQWVESRSQDGGDPSVYLDTAGIVAYAQANNINPVDLLGELGVTPDQIADALKSRGDLIVPVSRIMVGVADSEHRDGVLAHMREHPGAPTAVEAELILSKEKELFDQAEKEQQFTTEEMQKLDESAQRVSDDIRGRIEAMPGQDPETAGFQADLWRSIFRTQAAIHGLDPWKLYQTMPVFIESTEGGAQVGGQRFEQGAYHGSGVRGIQRMLMQKVATGTGALMQGWGIYSAEQRDVAEMYRKELGEKTGGQIYKLEIPEQSELLNLDARFSQQPAHIQEAIQKALKASGISGVHIFGEDPTGQQIYDDLALTWGRPGNKMARRKASMALLEAGIPGSMYLDLKSRDKGEGTRNFVVWDESRIQISDTYYQGAREGEPVSPFKTPVGAEGRIGRLLKRKKGVGHPKNKRKTLHLADGTTLTVGKLNVGDWIKRVRQTTSVDDIHDFRQWYRTITSAFEQAAGENVQAWAAAWMRAQQNASPSQAMLSMLRVREQIVTGTTGKKGGLADPALRAFWSAIERGDPDALSQISGGAQKLYDFVDSMLGKTTRTWMGNDERGGRPAVIDVHTKRDVGLVDSTLIDALRKQGVKESELAGIEVDAAANPTEAQYEYGRQFLERVTDHLNKRNMWGGNWTPAEVQATGWMSILNQLGKSAETAELSIARQTRQLSSALIFGEGAPYNETFSEFLGMKWDAQQRVTDRVTRRALELVQRMVGDPPVLSVETGAGGWLDYDAEPSTQIQILGSPEAANDLADALGYLLQQTGIRVEQLRPITKGENIPADANSWFVDLIDLGKGSLKEAGVQSKFWEHLRKLAPDLEAGFHPVNDGGSPGIRIGVDRTMFPGKTGMEKLRSLAQTAFQAAADATELDLGVELDIDVRVGPGRAETIENNWEENPNGEDYLQRLEARLGPDVSTDLRNHRGQVEIELKKGIAEEQDRAERESILPERFFQAAPAAEGKRPAPRAETEFVDGKALIRLFKGNDLSSLLHEGGHVFLKMFETLATNPNAPEQTQRDWQTLVEAARKAKPGTEPGKTLTKDQIEWIIEDQWEKSYLARGKAPSVELAGAFNSFKAWIFQVYQWARGKNIEMDPEIAAVFDRWLATEQEIETLEASREYRPVWTSREQSGRTEAEWADYQDRVRRAQLASRTESMSEALEAELREERRWWRSQRDRIERDVTAAVNSEPVHYVTHWLRTGEWLPGVPEIDLEPVKLSRAWIIEAYGHKGAQPLLESLARGAGKLYQTEEGGLTGPEAAELFGFSSGDELIKALAQAPDREAVIRERTEASLRGLAETREDAPQRAVDAMHTDVRGELLAQELAWLAEQGVEISEEIGSAPPAEPAAAVEPEGETFEQPGRKPTKTELALRKARDEARERAEEAERTLKASRVASARAWKAASDKATRAARAEAKEGARDWAAAVKYAEQRQARAEKQDNREQAKAWEEAARRARQMARGEAVEVRQALRLNVGQARQEAQRRVAKMRLMDLRPDATSGTERRAANEVQQALIDMQDPRVPLEKRAQLIDIAVEAKRVQLVNHFMFREVRKAKAETTRGEKWLRTFQTDKVRAGYGKIGGRPHTYLDRIDELMEAFTLKGNPSQEELDNRQRFDLWLAAEEKEGHQIQYPDKFVMKGVSHFQQMTVEDMNDLVQTVKHLDHQAKIKKQLLSHKNAIYRDVGAAELAGRAYATHTELAKKRKDYHHPTFLETTREFIGGADASLLKIEQLVDWLDGKDPNGPWRRLIWNPISDAQAKYYEILDEKVMNFQMILRHLDKQDSKWMHEKISAPKLGRSFMGYELVALALNLGTESNLGKMLKGHTWEHSDVMDLLEANLQDGHWEAVQRIWDLLEGMWGDIDKNEKMMSGLSPKKLVQRNFQLQSGRQMRGGYYPMVYDHMLNHRMYHYNQAADALMEYNWTKPETEHGHTHERAEHFSAPMLFDLRTVPNHLARVAHDLSHRHVLLDAYGLLSHPEVQGAVSDTLGENYAKLFVPWLQGIAKSTSPDRELHAFETVLRKLRYNTTIMAMGWKMTTMMSQFAGYFNSLEWLMNHGDKRGHYWMLYGLRHLGKNRRLAYDTVMKMSKELPHRMSSLDREIAENTARLQGQAGKVAWIQRNAFVGIGVMDMAVSIPTWIAAYHQAAAAGHGMDVAIRTADSAVRMSQGAGGRKDLSAFARGGEKHSEWQKAAGMFMSYFSALYSRQRNAYKELRQTGREEGIASKEFVQDFGRWLIKQLYLVIFPTVAAELLSGRGPEEDDDWVEWALHKSLYGNFASIPLIREAANTLDTGYDYQPTPLSSGVTAALNLIEEGLGGFGEDGEWELDKMIKHTVRTAGYAIGLPLEQPINITGKQAIEMLTGDRAPSLHDLAFRGEKL